MYAELCRDRCRHALRHLCRELFRGPYLALNPTLLTKPLKKPFKKSYVSSYASISRFKYRLLRALMSTELHGQTWPPGRPLGRPLHGRIVVPCRLGSICCMSLSTRLGTGNSRTSMSRVAGHPRHRCANLQSEICNLQCLGVRPIRLQAPDSRLIRTKLGGAATSAPDSNPLEFEGVEARIVEPFLDPEELDHPATLRRILYYGACLKTSLQHLRATLCCVQ